MEGPRTTDHGGNDERAAAHHRGYPLFEADYQLLEEIGRGANGSSIVFRAICLPNNEVVAIKCLDPATCHRTLDQVRAEATAMSLISHPNVLRAYCSFVAKSSLWVVMPYMAGGSCVHIMKAAFADGFEEPVIATILKETLKALNYLHQHGHIHRDVKARNILIDENGVVKLGDLGISACISDMGDLQQPRNDFEGTCYWMAPEVMEQLHGYDSRADIWSFGIAALELAHGRSPFSKYPPSKDFLMTFQTCLSLLDETCAKSCSSSFKEMVAICLVKDPSKRPTAEQLLSHPFFKNAQTCDFICQNVLDGLPPLAERAKQLKIIGAAQLALKRTSFSVDKLQTEYKREVSKWNFHVEDVKAEGTVVTCGGDPSDIDAQAELGRGDYCIQRKSSCSLEVIDIIAERDAAVLEKSIALTEKMAAYQERDSAIMQRDLALVDRDAAILSRDAAIATLSRLERKAAGRSRKKPQAPQDGLMHGSKMLQRVELTENCSLASECHPSAGHASHSGIMVLDAESTHCQAGIHRFGRDKEPDIEIFVRTKRKGANLTDVTVRGKHSQPPPKKSRNWPLTHQGQQQPGHHPEGATQVDDEEEEGQIREPELLKSRVFMNTPIPYCSCTGLNQQCYRWGNGGWQSACCTTMISMFPLPMNPKKRGSRLAGRKMSAGAFEKLLEKLVLEGVNISHPVDLREHWAKHGTNRYVTLR